MIKRAISLIAIFVIVIGFLTFLIYKNNDKLVNIEDITTDKEFENVVYDNLEDISDDTVIGILTIESIDLKATVKEGSDSDTLLKYVGHIEGTSTYDGNIGLAGHNRGCENSYFARINELEKGDIITYKTKFYEKQYKVDNIRVIMDTDWSLLENTIDNKITLITCIANKENQRLCVQATEIVGKL